MSTGETRRPEEASFHLPSLDGIRCFSFLIVFVAHAGLERLVPGGFGVTVFFFLSGYLITTLLRMEQERSGTVDFGAFYVRRALRILPPFATALVAATLCAATPVLSAQVQWRAVLAQGLYVANYWTIWHGYGGVPPGTGLFWSLSVEEHFYLLFPLLFLGLCRWGLRGARQAAALWSICALMLAWRCVLVFHFHAAPDRTYLATDTRVDSILFGCALAVWRNPALDPPGRLSERAWKYVLLPLGAAVLVVTFAYRSPAFRETWRYSLQGAALYPIFIVALRFPDWGPMRILNLAPVKTVGVLSYSLYLDHHAVLEALSRHLAASAPVVGVAGLAISLAIASAMHVAVERPSARMRKRVLAASAHRRLSLAMPVS